MFHKSTGILIKKTKLANGSFILKFYTKEYGIKSYFGRISKKDKVNYFPLTVANITAYNNSKKSIYSIKEYEVTKPFRNIFNHIYKSNVLIFINEILNNVIQEEETNPAKFEFIVNELITFDTMEFDPNFHLLFLLKLTRFIGIEPNLDGDYPYFDLSEGELISDIPIHSNFFDAPETQLFVNLHAHCYERNRELILSNIERKRTLQLLIIYYRYHIEMRDLKSLPVLETIFN